ncbi:MAG: DUF3089 domain-containing protein [Proteobacteria bacterium]|nr:DUF3089 domain-containing protein [Pseudomonadota bacterium]
MKRLVLALLLAACAAPGAFAAQPAPNDYTDPANWLCRPGRTDACTTDQTATVVNANGSESKESWSADPNAPVDCFYVYPTVSIEPTPNSDMISGPGEKGVVVQQVARLASKCRIYAPMYRQVTLAALMSFMAGKPVAASRELAYDDVRDAWQEYLAHDNHSRGVVLIGHSQGSGVLTELVKNEIDGKPIQKQIVSVILGGTILQVPVGKDVGGDFKSMPLCHSDAQTGCVIAFASFRANVPPPPGSRFGASKGPGLMAACVNPAALGGGSGTLDAYLPAGRVGLSPEPPVEWVKGGPPITTPFVKVPGLLTGECVNNEHGSYLAVTVHADPKDPRTDDIIGDVMVGGKVVPSWGLHLLDMNLTMGNLVDVVSAQSKAWLAANGAR